MKKHTTNRKTVNKRHKSLLQTEITTITSEDRNSAYSLSQLAMDESEYDPLTLLDGYFDMAISALDSTGLDYRSIPFWENGAKSRSVDDSKEVSYWQLVEESSVFAAAYEIVATVFVIRSSIKNDNMDTAFVHALRLPKQTYQLAIALNEKDILAGAARAHEGAKERHKKSQEQIQAALPLVLEFKKRHPTASNTRIAEWVAITMTENGYKISSSTIRGYFYKADEFKKLF